MNELNQQRHLKLAHKLFFGECWMITEEKLEQIIAFVDAKIQCRNIEFEAVNKGEKLEAVSGGIGVLPINGVISYRANMFTRSSGGTSIDNLTQQFRSLMSDPNVGSIVLNIDSPGGSTYGIQEFAAEVSKAKTVKPIVAIANPIAASAAYWIASAASKIVCIPSGMVGSIGCVLCRSDDSAADEASGIKHTIISAGKYKAEGYGPITDDETANLQALVDSYYNDFVGAVAKNRGTTASAVKSGYGQGRVVRASEAIEQKMIDKVSTLDDVVRELTAKKSLQDKRANLAAEYPHILGGVI